jgi:hypothetical protein
VFIWGSFLLRGAGKWGEPSGRAGRAQELRGGAGAERLGPQPPPGQRLGGAEQGGGEGLDFDPGPVALVFRQLGQHRVGDQLGEPPAVLGDAVGDLATARQGLVEEDGPGGAVTVEEGEEGVDAGT